MNCTVDVIHGYGRTGQQDGEPLGREDGQISIVKTRTRDGQVDGNRLCRDDGTSTSRTKSLGVKTKGKAREIIAMISRCVKARLSATTRRTEASSEADGPSELGDALTFSSLLLTASGGTRAGWDKSGASRRRTPRTGGRDGDSRGEFNFDILTFLASQARCVNSQHPQDNGDRSETVHRGGKRTTSDLTTKAKGGTSGLSPEDDPDSENTRCRLGVQDSLLTPLGRGGKTTVCGASDTAEPEINPIQISRSIY
ncbi:hypothetical protein A4X13_0g2981 [Tilletia indica]|uniref:Uncharacterized protein n=1 Tax=Tilletia indica TaxID=43049 RepID=A0A8T8T4U8_9BASI|nr:hypothetical protein A4X13_0g2981 [Tilletia indica]